MTSKPNLKDKPLSTSIFVQTKDRYEMKPPETYLQAVLPIMALDKEYECFGVPNLVKPCYTNHNYVETEYPLKA
ncbi:hypothetical protein H5410_036274 [Solanum commersonii]|uniref:Uncharacterized protein n=1 Tax=Solanum commersonii TaxID=4109 RepID=A0A9J5Y4W4_SOLCO|nr:hypothetical protein H5410_036274 [Solanum commersonii]